MDFVDLPAGPGGFFKVDNFKDCPALLVEVLRYEAQRPGNFGPKDTIFANVHAFKTEEDVKAGNAEVHQGVLIQNGPLVRDLRDEIGVGKATITKLGTAFFKAANKDGAVWRNVDAALKADVVAYAKAYTEKIAAEAADAPSFD